MDENGNDGGRTAMERLCRELMENVNSYSWCKDHVPSVIEDIDDWETWDYGKAIAAAKADILRRIEAARAEVEGWKDEAAELDALRGAGRVAPEGCRWPRFRDGSPLALGGEAYGRDGERLRVVAVTHRGKAAVRPWGRTDGRGARWVPLSSLAHERPDSWERLRDDALKTVSEYWGCGGWECHECPASVGGETPRQRYGTAGCFNAMHLDIVARAERLAGVRGDA